jgi:hypothetical protein
MLRRAMATESPSAGHRKRKKGDSTKARALKKKTKKAKPKKSKTKTKNAVVTVAGMPPAILPGLPLILDPDNDDKLLDFFRLFGAILDRKRSYRIVNDRGESELISKTAPKSLSKFVASLIVHYSIYCPFQKNSSSNIFSRCKLSDFDGLWHQVSRRDHTVALIHNLQKIHPFMDEDQDAMTFIKSYKFGQSHQHYRAKFLLPKGNPTRWWKDGHQFDGRNCYGLHEDFKPFFDLLGVPFSVEADEE